VSCDRAPEFLGAYVLGALDPAERRAAEAHLARCPACADELAGFRGLTAQLDRVPADEVMAEPVTAPPELFGRVIAAVRPPAWRRWPAIAAAAAVLVGVGVTWGVLRDDPEVRTATAGDLWASVSADEARGGTSLDVTVTGMADHETCELVVVDDAGGRHPAGEWPSYGGELSYRVWSEVPTDDLADVVLLGSDGSELVRLAFSE
jgi:hypothetical protein